VLRADRQLEATDPKGEKGVVAARSRSQAECMAKTPNRPRPFNLGIVDEPLPGCDECNQYWQDE